ncbi:EamA family transporter [Haloferax sp. MBLA0076]|uniref:EamA family transporter n=1 Tax=Haloferax litoreum TaxID=2666140 RepID=A0A6A8GJE7_9EURY|nr:MULTISPECIES: EamA family transporter [Haloferax]KAB1194873.1 EamA family transporter [Haloferax sp. CBA1148]MRX23096.1 EamA family transporter [Haloferax litoreum]
MNYISWAVVALGAYSLVAPLMKVATTGQGKIPSDVAALIANGVLVAATIGVIVVSGQNVSDSVVSSKLPYVLFAGVCLAVGILSYYRALALGPVSIVAPIFGMFLALSSVVGIVALGEPVTIRKAAGILFAVLAVVLVSVE